MNKRPSPRPTARSIAAAEPTAKPIAQSTATAKPAPRLTVEQSRVRRLLAPFRKKGPDGRPLYSKADRKRVYQLLMVTLIPAARFGSLRPELQAMTGELSRAAGAQRATSP